MNLHPWEKLRRRELAPPHQHTYGGFTREHGFVRLVCAGCREPYRPDSSDCPHPQLDETDDAYVTSCPVCYSRVRMAEVTFLGGPKDGEIEKISMLSLAHQTSFGLMLATTEGQVPDEAGKTMCFTYWLRWDGRGRPFWCAPGREPEVV